MHVTKYVMSNDRKRVKVYVHNKEGQWIDHGTGYISTLFLDNEKQTSGIVLQVRSENDGKTLLESKISTDIVYKKEQDTLIVWSENDNNLALSFQLKEGCSDIWQKICEIQGNDISYDETSYEEPVQDFALTVKLPPVELSKLDDISEFLHDFLTSEDSREKLATAIERDSYIKELIDVFHMCEDLDNVEGLHTLYEILKTLFMLEKNSLFEIMFLPENIMEIVGILEYDPSKKEAIPHREFLTKKINFKEVIPISNPELLNKIHQTYRLQYIKDILVPVPSLFDENMSTLSSFLFFCKIEIVTLIQEDPQFLTELFTKLTDDELSDDKRKETILLLKEICSFSQTLQQANRNTFIKILSEHGLLPCMEQLLNIEDSEMRSAIVDILACVVEFYPSLVREYLCKEANTTDEDAFLLNILIDMLLTGSETGQDIILLQLIRNLLDPENMGFDFNKMEKSEFLGFFYRHCMHTLTAPIFAITGTDILTGKDDYRRAAILDHIIELLTFCVIQHSHNMKHYLIGKDLLKRVLVLMQSRHKFLALAALRFCRKVIGLKDEFYNRYIIVGKLLKPIINAFKANGSRYNLLNSAIIDLFEFIRTEDIKTLCTYIVENHIEELIDITYVGTFSALKLKYEQEQDRINRVSMDREEQASTNANTVGNLRKRRDDRVLLDEEEETWFNLEDEEINTTPPLENQQETNSPTTKPINTKLKDVDLIDNKTTVASNRPVSPHNNGSPRPSSPTNNTDKPTSLQNNKQNNTIKPISPNKNMSNPQNNIDNQQNNTTGPQNNTTSPPPQKMKPVFSNHTDNGISKSRPIQQRSNSPIGNNNFSSSTIKIKSPVNRTIKPLGSHGNKPLINIKINTNHLNSNETLKNDTGVKLDECNKIERNNHVEDNNGTVSNDVTKLNICKAKNAVQIHNHNTTPQVKPLLTSLVDYPDDDDEESPDDEMVQSSPAKKQRIGST